jgi:hypothetical protein
MRAGLDERNTGMGNGLPPAVRWIGAVAALAVIVLIAAPLALDQLQQGIVINGGSGSGGAAATEPGAGVSPSPGSGTAPSSPSEAAAPPVATTGPVEDGSAEPVADFVVSDGSVEGPSAEELELDETDDAVYAAFPPIAGTASCVEEVSLRLEAGDGSRTELRAYAAALGNPEGLEVGQEVPSDTRLGESVSTVALFNGAPGVLEWEVTDQYDQIIGSEQIASGAPLVFTVQPTGNAAAGPLELTASEASSGTAPTLSWEGESGCS